MKIRPAVYELLHAYRLTCSEMTFVKADDVFTHAQMIIENDGILFVPLEDLEDP
jgi:hypothetical protein